MKSMKDTRKRKFEDEPQRTSRRSSNDTLDFLKEKIELDREMKKKELESKKKDHQAF